MNYNFQDQRLHSHMRVKRGVGVCLSVCERDQILQASCKSSQALGSPFVSDGGLDVRHYTVANQMGRLLAVWSTEQRLALLRGASGSN